jgi:arylsulfatase A
MLSRGFALIFCFFYFPEAISQDKTRPNIVILLADDLGYADLSCYGSKEVNTPVLDKLAGEGMRFTDFYAASAVCSPSRAALMTGRFSVRAGVYSWIHPSQKMHLHRNENTIAELLKDHGYQSAHIGKWHLGYDLETGSGPGPAPHDHGFDYWLATGNNASPSHHNPDNFIRNGKALGVVEGYSSQIVVDEAIEWLDSRNESEPFFLNLWFHEPHAPVAAPLELSQKHGHTTLPAYYGSIENMDSHIGRLLKKLEDTKLSNNTIVIFMSDNGSYRGKEGSNGELKAGKTTLWEGGIRVPGIIRWPGHIEPGLTEKTPAGVVDILPTICEITNVTPPAHQRIDGVSLVPLFNQKRLARKRPLYWLYSPARPVCVIRQDDWCLTADPALDIPKDNLFKEEWIELVKKTALVDFQLFNVRKDPGQHHNVAAKNRGRTKAMKKKMVALHREIVDEAIDWRHFNWHNGQE